ncbi:DNA-3-methyladenine glycosylase [Vallitalea okinawensis]|uniref:DNA-3-methyladenine glycosylase n=1 Tax=Vallitalea okinawensis TaxID=2078660 RepID=UPI000CFB1029|nr:DNA-3-methyladenine glycosylase [Vallitalea okinawensis]
MRLTREFYYRDTLQVAKDLLGKMIVRYHNQQLLKAMIIETEAYIGTIDKACHAYGGRRTNRTEVMFSKGGLLYVYQIYGLHFCMNVVTEEEGTPCAVLIRGVQPVEGIDSMAKLRYGQRYDELTSYKIKNFSNGPGKLCHALSIDKSDNGIDLCHSKKIYISDTGFKASDIHESKRINIDYAEEARDFLWRFQIKP